MAAWARRSYGITRPARSRSRSPADLGAELPRPEDAQDGRTVMLLGVQPECVEVKLGRVRPGADGQSGPAYAAGEQRTTPAVSDSQG